MMPMKPMEWYDKEGKPLTSYDAIEAQLRDSNYKIVKQTELSNGLFVSTVWLGLNHNFGQGPPLIFETMVFKSKSNFDEIDMSRYATLEQAKVGHKKFVNKYKLKKNI